jgi:hypothetical protein
MRGCEIVSLRPPLKSAVSLRSSSDVRQRFGGKNLDPRGISATSDVRREPSTWRQVAAVCVLVLPSSRMPARILPPSTVVGGLIETSDVNMSCKMSPKERMKTTAANASLSRSRLSGSNYGLLPALLRETDHCHRVGNR